MGIKESISKEIPDELNQISSFEVLRNRRMGVDVSNYMFKLVTTRDSLVREFPRRYFYFTSTSIETRLRKFAINLTL